MLYFIKQRANKHEWHNPQFLDSIPFSMRKRSACHLLSCTDFSCDGFIALLPLALTPFETKGSALKYARFFKIGGFGSGKDLVKFSCIEV